jgi:hypothetical protein
VPNPAAHNPNLPAPDPNGELIIENEFASVTVSVDQRGHDDRLVITDNKTGQRAYYDALLLETLAWIPEPLLKRLLDPSLHRWPDPPA